MIVLKNIKKNDHSIEADFYPEGVGSRGFVKISLPDGDFIEKIPSADYPGSGSAFSHAQDELLRIAKLDKIPKEKTVLWY